MRSCGPVATGEGLRENDVLADWSCCPRLATHGCWHLPIGMFEARKPSMHVRDDALLSQPANVPQGSLDYAISVGGLLTAIWISRTGLRISQNRDQEIAPAGG